MPIKYWGKCVLAAVYLLNRLPSSDINGKTPYELLYSKSPSLSHLRVIGCLCYASSVPKGDKFSERAKSAVLMGYSETQKGYLLMELNTKSFFVSRDVVFKEDVFPFFISQEVVQIPEPVILDSDLFEEDTDDCGTTDSTTDGPVDMSPSLSHAPISDPVETSLPTHDDIPIDPPPIRHTARLTKQPIWMKDYAAPTKKQPCKYPIANHLSYNKVILHIIAIWQTFPI